MTGTEALRSAIARLALNGVANASRDARLLLAHAMQIAVDRVALHVADALSEAATQRFAAAVAARVDGQPISQIIGHRLFWNRRFRVTPDVLDPRPETETLIAAALKIPARTVLDLGTGSGVILLTLLAEWPDAWGQGTDISTAALAIAVQNARDHGLGSRCDLTVSDWFAAVERRFDLIVSNPPYITADELPQLAPEVLNWEPHIALTPGGDGLGAYRQIVANAGYHLNPGGRLMVECGPTQGPAVAGLFVGAGLLAVRILPDMDNRDRVVTGQTAG